MPLDKSNTTTWGGTGDGVDQRGLPTGEDSLP
jgi:hypothetical protein